MPGRPKLHRRNKQPGEVNGPKDKQTQSCKTITKIRKMVRQGLIITCSLCHQQRHNAKECPLKKVSGQQNNTRKRKRTNTQGVARVEEQGASGDQVPVQATPIQEQVQNPVQDFDFEAPVQESQNFQDFDFEIPLPQPSQDTVETGINLVREPTRRKLQISKKAAITTTSRKLRPRPTTDEGPSQSRPTTPRKKVVVAGTRIVPRKKVVEKNDVEKKAVKKKPQEKNTVEKKVKEKKPVDKKKVKPSSIFRIFTILKLVTEDKLLVS